MKPNIKFIRMMLFPFLLSLSLLLSPATVSGQEGETVYLPVVSNSLNFQAATSANVKRLVVRVAHERDDGEELPDGKMKLIGNVLDLGQDQTVGLRFENVALPKKAIVQRATVTFVAQGAQSGRTRLAITAERGKSPARFTFARSAFGQRPKLSQSVPWDVPAWNPKKQSAYESPDLSALVQTIANGGDWSPGSAMAFYFAGSGHRMAASHEKAKSRGKLDRAPTLIIEYTEEGEPPRTGDGGSPAPSYELMQEAEAASLSGSFGKVSARTASGGFFIQAKSGRDISGPSESHRARFVVDVSQAGKYRLNGRVLARTGGSNSFWIRVDGGSPVYWNLPVSSNFRWAPLSGPRGVNSNSEQTDGNGNMLLLLSKGRHQIDVYRREPQTGLDQLRLERTDTNVRIPAPTNTPPPQATAQPTNTPPPQATAQPTSTPLPADTGGTARRTERQNQALREMSGIRGDSFRASIHRHTASLLLGQNANASANWFKNQAGNGVRESWEWNGLLFLRSYHALKGERAFIQSGAEAEARRLIQGDFLNQARRDHPKLKMNSGLGSENHSIVRLSIQLLLEEMAPSRNNNRYNQAKRGIEQWAREKATRGYTEYMSPHYTERLMIALTNIHDYSTDAEMRRWAQISIDQIMAEYAVVQINGFRGGAHRRFYECVRKGTNQIDHELTDGRQDSLYAAGYILMGLGNQQALNYRGSDQAIGLLAYSTTNYRTTSVHSALAQPNNRNGIELRSGRRWEHSGNASSLRQPDASLYAYITPHYVLSSIRIPQGQVWGKGNGPNFNATLNRGTPFRVSFADPRAMVGSAKTVGSDTYCASLVTDNAPVNALALFQHENVVLYQGKASDYRDLAGALGPSGNQGMDRAERDGPFTFYREAGTGGQTIYVATKEQNGLGVMVVELANQHGSWDRFKQSIRQRTIALNSANNITYDGSGTRIDYRGFNNVRVDGRSYETRNWGLYESPLLNASWQNQGGNPGLITVGNSRTGTLKLDFTAGSGPRRIQ